MTSIQRLVDLLQSLLANTDRLPDHTTRDPVTKKLLYRSNPNGTDWALRTITTAFPEQTVGSTGLGGRLRHLVGKYVLTTDDLELVEHLLKQLHPYINSAQSLYYSKMKAAMTRSFLSFKDEAFLAAASLCWVQTPAEKASQRQVIPDRLDERLESPIEFDLQDVLLVVQANKETIHSADMGILLELALGCRSIDLLRSEIMELSLHDTDPEMVVLTGHSKVRSDEQWELTKSGSIDLHPVGLTPAECVRMLGLYRTLIPQVVAAITEVHKDDLHDLTDLQAMQFVNNKLTVRYAEGLRAAARRCSPSSCTVHQPSVLDACLSGLACQHGNLLVRRGS